LFVIAMVAVYRLGVVIRVPGVDPIAIEQLRASASQQGALGFLNLFSGGAFESFSIFALGIMPYITASIIMQVLGVVIPKLEELQNEGAVGQRKITQYTRYVTIGLATLQATGLVFIFGTGRGTAFFSAASSAPTVPLLPDGVWPRGYLIIPTLVAGTAVLMWISEMISQRGIGNGMSMIIFASVVAGLPAGFWSILQLNKVFWFVAMVLLTLGIIVAVVYVELGQRRIPVQFAKRQVGRRMYGGQNTYIPLKVNASGVIPIIFASSMLYLPVMISTVLPGEQNSDGSGGNWAWQAQQFIDDHFRRGTSVLYLTVYGLLIIGFAYFYAAIQFDPHKQADQIRKQGGFIPGIRPGYQTERYLAKILSRITLPGALFVASIALIPAFVLGKVLGNTAGGQQLGFFGISILIAVGVAIETVKQVDGQLMMRNYEGFLNTKTKTKSSTK